MKMKTVQGCRAFTIMMPHFWSADDDDIDAAARYYLIYERAYASLIWLAFAALLPPTLSENITLSGERHFADMIIYLTDIYR